MKTITVTATSNLAEVLDEADEEGVVLKTPEGREFLLTELDDFGAEVEAVRRNPELMEFLDQRSRAEKSYTLEEVRKRLGLD